MDASFNLIDRPWLLCVDAGGQAQRLGLYDALTRAHELRQLQGETPLATAALHRLLLAILHRNFGPRSMRDWRRLWEAGRWDRGMVQDYCEHWFDRFGLFDAQRPFYQTREPPGSPEPVNSRLSLPHAYNSTLFEHQLKDGSMVISPARAAEWLITLQAAGIGTGPPKHPYVQGPLVNSLLVMVQGDTLFETLCLNLVVYNLDTDKPIPAPRKGQDLPIWEYDENPYPPDPKTQYLPGYVGYLTWLVRTVHLFPAWEEGELCVRECAIAQGPRLDHVDDPMKVYVMAKSKDVGMLPVRLSEDRAMWRDSGALFRLGEQGVRPPVAFDQLAQAMRGRVPGLDCAKTYNYLTLGLCNSNARLDFFRHERMPLPLAYLTEDSAALRENLVDALRVAEDVAQALRMAGRDFARWYVSPVDKRKANRDDVNVVFSQLNVENRYWPNLETPFARFVTDLPENEQAALDHWVQLLKRTARDAFAQATQHVDDPHRGLKALALAEGSLTYGLNRVIDSAAKGSASEGNSTKE